MRSTRSAYLIGHIKFLLWGQLDGCGVTRPFLSLRRVGLRDYTLILGQISTVDEAWNSTSMFGHAFLTGRCALLIAHA